MSKKERCTEEVQGEIRRWLSINNKEYVAIYEYAVENHYYANMSEPVREKKEGYTIRVLYNKEMPEEHIVLEFDN